MTYIIKRSKAFKKAIKKIRDICTLGEIEDIIDRLANDFRTKIQRPRAKGRMDKSQRMPYSP